MASLQLPYRKVILGAGLGTATLTLSLPEEAQSLCAGEFRTSPPAGLQFNGDVVQLARLPEWPIAVLEPSEQSQRLLMELFLDDLPLQIRDSIVRIGPGSDISTLVHDAMRQHAIKLFGQLRAAEEALSELLQLCDEAQWDKRRLDQSTIQGAETEPGQWRCRHRSDQATGGLKIADPFANYMSYRDEIDAAISEAISTRQYVLGPVVERFEHNFAAYVGVSHGVAVNSGTDAIHIAIRALGIGKGDEIITVSKTSVATVAAIEMSGATPILVDIEPEWLTIDPSAVEAVIGPATRGVVAVHLYGQPANLPALRKICRRHNLALIEDCAQSHGAAWGQLRAGSYGDVSCFSFYPTKNLGTIGDGGIILTNDQRTAENARQVRQYGWTRPQWSERQGCNSRLGPIEAAILDVKLRHLPSMLVKRRELSARYRQLLSGCPLSLPVDRPGTLHAYHLFVVRTNDGPSRDALKRHLTDRGISVQVHYPAPVHLQPAYLGRLKHGDLPHTFSIYPCVLSLPLYPELTTSQQQCVIDAINGFRWEGH